MFGKRCSLIGVVHVLPLPGSAGYGGRMDEIISAALADARVYQQQGADALLFENMHDVPYLKGRVEPETTAAMTAVARAIKEWIPLPSGVQILAAANLEALAVAVAAGLDFVRVEGFVYAHVGDEGMHESCAAELVRRRAHLKAEQVKIFADIKKKHSAHAITSDVSLVETAETAQFFRSDGVIVTGSATGRPADIEEVRSVREAVNISVLVGSGVDAENIGAYAAFADGLIVGSAAKVGGSWANKVDPDRVAALVAALERALAEFA